MHGAIINGSVDLSGSCVDIVPKVVLSLKLVSFWYGFAAVAQMEMLLEL